MKWYNNIVKKGGFVMGYQALYRKYRPKNLKQVYGQNIAVNILKNAVEKNKFGHAYLFTGSRGCGKTSVAKILSRMVNCENVKDGEMCGKCKGCINSSVNNCVDIIEIDAASNNGVDEIRELKSKVNLIPSSLKYKVYIIDEVHMLSIGAFNALLKTLEEPPEHVIFILATTELHKVPITILSRCQTIEFKKINNKDMFRRLKEISDLESIDITEDALEEIVNNSDGGLRDAIGMLDMATSYNSGKITEEDIYAINGNISNDEIEYIAEQIIKQNLKTIINQINDYHNNGKDLLKILEKIIITLKNKMIKENDSNICLIIEKLAKALEKMRNSSIGKIYLELAIFEICIDKKEEVTEKNNIKDEVIKEKIKKEIIEKENIHDELNVSEFEKVKKCDTNLKNIRINNTFVEVNKQSLNEIKSKWDFLNDYTFDKEYGASVCELLDANPIAASNKYLILTYNYDSFVEKGNIYISKYERTLKNTIGIDIKLVFLTNDEWNKIKKEYITNIKNNVKYNYIDENGTEIVHSNDNEKEISVRENSSDILEKANELFDMNKIEIKEIK